MRRRRSTPNRGAVALDRSVCRSTAVLLIAAYAATWSAPCVPVSVAFEATRIVQSDASAPHAFHADRERVEPSAAHEGHDAVAIGRDGAGPYLVAKCSCGCGTRPQAAGTATAPGYALLVQMPALPSSPLEVERAHVAPTPIRPPPGDSIDHVPIYFLS